MLKRIAGKVKSSLKSPTAKKVGIGLLAAGATAAAGYGAYKLLKGRKGAKTRTSSPAKLRNQVLKIALKIKKMQLTNRLRKEQMKVSL